MLLFEELAGLVEVRVARDDHGAVTGATIAAPQPLSLGLELPVEAVAACAGLQPDDIVTTAHWPIQASVGYPYAIAEVTDDALTRATPQIDAFRRALGQFPALGTGLALYVYARGPGSDIRARMFAPLGGTFEDPATGSAATPLAALLLSLGDAAEARYDIAQGVEMRRPSLLRTTARRAPDGIRTWVGGDCVPVLRGAADV